jgi:hypothetical protein
MPGVSIVSKPDTWCNTNEQLRRLIDLKNLKIMVVIFWHTVAIMHICWFCIWNVWSPGCDWPGGLF